MLKFLQRFKKVDTLSQEELDHIALQDENAKLKAQ